MNNLCLKRLVKIFFFFFLENNEIKTMAVATQTIGLLGRCIKICVTFYMNICRLLNVRDSFPLAGIHCIFFFLAKCVVPCVTEVTN